jgi:hypothetical protein
MSAVAVLKNTQLVIMTIEYVGVKESNSELLLRNKEHSDQEN